MANEVLIAHQADVWSAVKTAPLSESLIESANTIRTFHFLWDSLSAHPQIQKIGPFGVMTMIHKALEIGLKPLDALIGGDMTCINGKIELSAQAMNALIRRNGNRIETLESTEQKCTVKGTRASTGETETVTFTIEDAKRAGILSNQAWQKYPKAMLYARAISTLGRRLFPDVIRGIYVEGEISQAIEAECAKKEDFSKAKKEPKKIVSEEEPPVADVPVLLTASSVELVTADEANQLSVLYENCTEDYKNLLKGKIPGVMSLVPRRIFTRMKNGLIKNQVLNDLPDLKPETETTVALEA